MKKHVIPIICIAFIAVWAACSQPGGLPQITTDTTSSGGTLLLLSEGKASTAQSPRTTPVTISTPTIELDETSGPDIPTILDELYLGAPAGNGHRPYHVAVDGQRGRAYTLNYGRAPSGTTISVLDLESGEVSDLIHLDNMRAEDSLLPDPLDLQVDPYRPRLYAVWGDRYAEATDSTLIIIDTDTLGIVDMMPGVEAVAPGPDRLYLVKDTRLWSVDPIRSRRTPVQ